MLYDLEFTSFDIFRIISSMVLFTIGLIVFLRFKIQKASDKLLENPPSNDKRQVNSRNKHKSVDAFRFSNSLLKYGLLVAIGFSLTIISWTTVDKIDYSKYITEKIEDETMEVELKKVHIPKPPPPPPIIEPIIDDINIVDDIPDIIPKEVIVDIPITLPVLDTSMRIDTSVTSRIEVSRIPIFKKEEPKDDEIEPIFKIVEEMPRFPGCEDITDKNERESCAKKRMMKFIYKNIKYPKMAIEQDIQGTCNLQFVVSKTGEITDIELVKNIGYGCGKTAVKAITKMKNMSEKWTPGKQRGKVVNVRYTLPVNYRLD